MNKKVFSLFLIIIALASIATVSASDINNCTFEMNSDENNVGNLNLNDENVNSSNDDFYGNWNDLNNDIQNLKPGDIYNIKSDYKMPNNVSLRGIDIAVDNVTINGNNHSIELNYANGFTVSANNVKIINLTFKGGDYGLSVDSDNSSDDTEKNSVIKITDNIIKRMENEIKRMVNEIKVLYNGFIKKLLHYIPLRVKSNVNSCSPLVWFGSNGICSNCLFFNNKAIVGGAVSWYGDNGKLYNNVFFNNSAERLGGDIYLNAFNCSISNSYFINSTSIWADDCIYKGPNYKNGTFEKLYTSHNASDFFMDGSHLNFNPMTPEFKLSVFNIFSRFDFTRCIFNILTYGGLFTEDGVTYYGQILNGTDFLLAFNSLEDGFFVNQEFYFSNVTSNNITCLVAPNVFKSLNKLNFTVNFICLKVVNITNIDEYENATKLKANNIFKKIISYCNAYHLILGVNTTCVKGLGVNFLDKYTFKTHATWKPKDMGFDTIYINGHNSKIVGGAGKRKEYKWAVIKKDYTLTVDDLTISGFNNAIINEGECILNNVCLEKNKMKYIIERDWGAAILNSGFCVCTNCVFINNSCCKGGAIFTQGYLILNNCIFEGNDAYKKGDTILNVDKGTVIMDGEQINGSSGVVTYVKSISSTWDKIVKWGAIGISFIVGAVVGFCTFNPIIGVAAGAFAGLLLGSIAGAYLSCRHYDMHYNALKATGILIAECVGAGILGGLCGYFLKAGITYFTTPTAEAVQESAKITIYEGIEVTPEEFGAFEELVE